MHYTVLLFIRAPFYVSLVFVAMCAVFWLFWLSYQYLPSDGLERLLWGSLIVARGSSPESPGRRVRMILLVYLYCFIVLLCICVVSCPYVIYYPTVMAQYSLFVLKVPLNTKQTNKQTRASCHSLLLITSICCEISCIYYSLQYCIYVNVALSYQLIHWYAVCERATGFHWKVVDSV